MKVKELINFLKGVDQELTVLDENYEEILSVHECYNGYQHPTIVKLLSYENNFDDFAFPIEVQSDFKDEFGAPIMVMHFGCHGCQERYEMEREMEIEEE